MVDNVVQPAGHPDFTLRRHPRLYIQEDAVVIRVEDTLYRSHRHFFCHRSKVFADLFSLPPEKGKPVEGLTDEHPVVLEGVSCLDFERLLCLFYPEPVCPAPWRKVYDAGAWSLRKAVRDWPAKCFLWNDWNVSEGDLSTAEEWTSILALATKWDFTDYRQLAISRLAQLASPVDRILLGRLYDIPEWLSAAYLELCTRDDALTYEEGVRLGMHDVILLSDIRQSIRGNRVTMQDRNISILVDRRLG